MSAYLDGLERVERGNLKPHKNINIVHFIRSVHSSTHYIDREVLGLLSCSLFRRYRKGKGVNARIEKQKETKR
tara:strand:+ start:90 stop:308 length:219 start_codon:yes stop_codon:yes gene_type:complete